MAPDNLAQVATNVATSLDTRRSFSDGRQHERFEVASANVLVEP